MPVMRPKGGKVKRKHARSPLRSRFKPKKMSKYVCSALLLLQSIVLSAQVVITGTVKDSKDAQGLPGATVQVLGTNIIAVADETGWFRLENVKGGEQVLLVRFLGYQEKQATVNAGQDVVVDVVMEEASIVTDEVVIEATRASDKTPTTYVNIGRQAIQKQNFGQDLPLLLNWSTSVVTTSDAGGGVGYTGIRIRGSDATRINVTINGIPYNDSESQGVYWVDVPDIATSTQSIQLQRGVGTSSNGAGAFGATINLQTNTRNDQSYADVITSVGSFGTLKNTLGLGSGLINNKFVFDGRVSRIVSDGFIDRASSDLTSYYLAGGYYGKKTMVKAIAFGGKEITYQSWWGVPQSRLNNDLAAMNQTAADEGWNAEQTQNLLNSDPRTFNHYTYKDQVDNYGQYHYQLHFSQRILPELTANASLHATMGKGYYEEFKYDASFADYGIANPIIGTSEVESSDLVRRRWLDNTFYGFTWSLNYEKEKLVSTLGGGSNNYSGDHFGEITWAAVAVTAPKDYRYYFSNGKKSDFNIYWKNNYQVMDRLFVFADLQLRMVSYSATGTENELQPVEVDAHYQFFNPKFGFTYKASEQSQWYASYAIANREPVRDDFINSPAAAPKPETLGDLEIGYRSNRSRSILHANFYYMSYKNQLVLTGQLNDVGNAIRTNVDESYRMGIEVEGSYRVSNKISWNLNLTVSKNVIKNFTEVLYDYGINYDEYNEVQNQHPDTQISFSPSVIGGSSLTWRVSPGFDATLLSKYVGQQYLDNTSDEARKIDGYFTNDVRLNYSIKPSWMREIGISLLVNNILDVKYSSNGYTWGYYSGAPDAHRQNYFYPQAGRNFMAMVALRF
jgi:iron complex outermembrane receptor protein